jgi:hypothetical protein
LDSRRAEDLSGAGARHDGSSGARKGKMKPMAISDADLANILAHLRRLKNP